MPSVVVTANTSAQTAFTTPTNKIGKITFLEIDNQHTAAIKITIQDVFTPTATVGVPLPSEVTVTRKVITVANGQSYSERIEGYIEIIGTCKVLADTTSTDCNITIGYEFE